MHVELLELLIPIIVPLGLFTMIVLITIQENQTKQKMIENGMNPKNPTKQLTPNALKTGGFLVGGGLGLFLASLLTNFIKFSSEEAIYFGLVALLGGLGLIMAHNIARKQYLEDKNRFND